MTKPDLRDPVLARYLTAEYANHNPSWDEKDSPWKADLVWRILRRGNLDPKSIAEVGCGAGGVLVELCNRFPKASFHGFDIAPAATQFWENHSRPGVQFTLGDFLSVDARRWDVVLMLDVLEHLANPFDYLARVRSRGDNFVFHIPLDLSALAVLRELPLLRVRKKVGHIHYFTRSLALTLLEECGFDVIDWQFTGAASNAPQRGLITKMASLPRRLLSIFSRDLSARLLGGETLVVLARPRKPD